MNKSIYTNIEPFISLLISSASTVIILKAVDITRFHPMVAQAILTALLMGLFIGLHKLSDKILAMKNR